MLRLRLTSRFLNRLRLRECEAGVATLELALLAPVMLLMLLPTVDLALGLYDYMEMTSSLRAGMHYALQNPDDTAGITSAVETGSGLEGVEVDTDTFCECDGASASCEASCSSGMATFMNISATYERPLLISYPGIGSVTTISQEISLRVP